MRAEPAAAPRLVSAGDRLERDALAACIAHPELEKLLAELAADHFDSDLNRRLRQLARRGRRGGRGARGAARRARRACCAQGPRPPHGQGAPASPAGATTAPRAGRGRASPRDARVATVLLLVGLAVLCVWLFLYETDRGARAIDFQSAIWNPLHRILDGQSPYLSPDDPTVVAGTAAAYPPFVMLAFAPLAALPYTAAAAIFVVLMAAASVGAVWAVGVRDVRCLLVLVSLPVAGSVVSGSPTPLVLLCAALGWRWRDRPWLAPFSVAAGIAIKFLIWPLVLWMAFTGRVRSAVRTVALCAALVLVPWTFLGSADLADYPELLGRLGQAGEADGLLSRTPQPRG